MKSKDEVITQMTIAIETQILNLAGAPLILMGAINLHSAIPASEVSNGIEGKTISHVYMQHHWRAPCFGLMLLGIAFQWDEF